MTARADMEVGPFALPPFREIGLWAAAALFVVMAHAVLAYTIQALRPLDPPAAVEPALMVDLSPLVVTTPESVEGQTVTEEIPEEQLQPVDEVPEVVKESPESVETAEVEETVEPDVVEPQQAEPEFAEAEPAEPEITEPEPEEPEIAEVVTPEVAVPLPEPRPVAEEKKRKPPERVARAEPRKEVEKPAAKKRVARAEAKAEAEAKPAPKAEASQKSQASRAPKISPAKWQSRVMAWLNRHKRYPRGARSRREQGVVSVSFAINASGSVTSARITRSSGNSELDQAALDMLRRASPVPAPPPGVGRNIALPVEFSLR
jgi:periplasmic protein TonB